METLDPFDQFITGDAQVNPITVNAGDMVWGYIAIRRKEAIAVDSDKTGAIQFLRQLVGYFARTEDRGKNIDQRLVIVPVGGGNGCRPRAIGACTLANGAKVNRLDLTDFVAFGVINRHAFLHVIQNALFLNHIY